jgi:hypothetical protein
LTIRTKFIFSGSLTTKYGKSLSLFCRLELENVAMYQDLPALRLTQSVHAKICIGMHRRGSDIQFPEYLS